MQMVSGGLIAGKAACEDFCMDGSSITSAKGAILNPVNPEYDAGGSSCGSAAVVRSSCTRSSLSNQLLNLKLKVKSLLQNTITPISKQNVMYM